MMKDSARKLAVLGCGNMNAALIEGLAKERNTDTFYFYTPTQTRAHELKERVGRGQVIAKLSELPPCDFYLMGCKPQQFQDLARELNPVIASNGVVISVLAGTPMEKLKRGLPRAHKLVRVMPNTPALVGEGVSLVFFSDSVTEEERQEVQAIFQTISKVFLMDEEEQLDRLTGLTGSGPGYLFQLAQWFSELIQEKAGVKEETAQAMTKQLFLGSAKRMASDKQTSPESLKEQVNSKKGVTAEALKILEQRQTKPILDEAYEAAWKRLQELQRE